MSRVLYVLGTQAQGGLALLTALLVAHHFGSIQVPDVSLLLHLAGMSGILWIGSRVVTGVRKHRSEDCIILNDDGMYTALEESETLRENILGAHFHLDEDDLDRALDESPSFAAAYLEEYLRATVDNSG